MRTWFWVVVALLAACTESLAQVPRIALMSVPLARPPISQPVFLTHAHDGSGRVFVIEQSGRIVLPRLTADPQLAVPVFLDIRSRVLFGGERGLLGLAFHPQFAINRRFFVNYTRAGDGATVIAEYRGVLRITSPSPIAVTALRGRTNERGEFLITATTPADEAASDSSSELLFPHFAVGDGYETQFVLFNTRSAQTQSGAIYFFSNSGLPKTLQLR